MYFALSYHALHVFETMTKQLGLSIMHQVIPQPAANGQYPGDRARFEGDPVGVASSFTWPEPGVGSRSGLRVAAVLAVAHVSPQRLDNRPLR